MYDSVSVGEIPTDAGAVALYIDGRYANWRAGVDHAKHANHLSIAVFPEHDAAALDVETGDATPSQAPAWVRRQLHRDPRSRPVIYASRDTMPQILAELERDGLRRSQVRLWSAHYTMGPHICSPRGCGAGFTADATQWTDRAQGRNLDESLLADGFFPAAPRKPKHRPAVHKKVLAGGGGGSLTVGILVALRAFGLVHLTPPESDAITAIVSILAGWAAPPGYLTPKRRPRR